MPTDPPNRAQRRADASGARKAGAAGALDTQAFLKIAGRFIDLANRENKAVAATELHMAFLYAAARYNAYVAKVVMDVDNHEAFVADVTKAYQDMLRQHLADPGLAREPE